MTKVFKKNKIAKCRLKVVKFRHKVVKFRHKIVKFRQKNVKFRPLHIKLHETKKLKLNWFSLCVGAWCGGGGGGVNLTSESPPVAQP